MIVKSTMELYTPSIYQIHNCYSYFISGIFGSKVLSRCSQIRQNGRTGASRPRGHADRARADAESRTVDAGWGPGGRQASAEVRVQTSEAAKEEGRHPRLHPIRMRSFAADRNSERQNEVSWKQSGSSKVKSENNFI